MGKICHFNASRWKVCDQNLATAGNIALDHLALGLPLAIAFAQHSRK